MRVTLLHPREFQDAGVIRALWPGEHDLPSVVAHALIASGEAVMAMAPPERAALSAAPEIKTRRRRVAA
jgi:hypothetical protein